MDIEVVTTTLTDQLNAYATGLIEATPRLVVAIIIILATWAIVALAKMLVRRLGGRFRLRRNLINVLAMMAGVGLWFVGLLTALTVVFPSITPGKALTTLGLGSVAIGFAFKDTFENFLAGILILLREPFQISDHIECDDVEGQVEEITIRDSHIRQTDGQLVVVPNHMLFQNAVVVRTDRDLRRTTVMCGVAYGEDVDEARSVILNAVEAVDSVRNDVKDVEVFAQSFGASSIDFEVTWWTGSRPIDIRRSRDQVVAKVKAALDEAGIEIPFPYRTLTFKEPLAIATDHGTKEQATADD
ncbi:MULTISPECIES: mechanosensitive ion channel family protein [unclassified Roseovarius]|uniref:mechanosensitive ion channel family protein n=1 Tax=unclassified Roseovarius TaxID=2614913 RepID=UPI00273D054F|nr:MULTISPECIES: mechanosensitive ion channel family protein [unclassified Roseovarius]